MDHDTKVAVDMLCDHVRTALSRIEKDALAHRTANDDISLDTVDPVESRGGGKVIGIRR